MQREKALLGRPVLLPGSDGPEAISGDARLLYASINATPDQIALLDELLTPLIKKNQYVNHIYETH